MRFCHRRRAAVALLLAPATATAGAAAAAGAAATAAAAAVTATAKMKAAKRCPPTWPTPLSPLATGNRSWYTYSAAPSFSYASLAAHPSSWSAPSGSWPSPPHREECCGSPPRASSEGPAWGRYAGVRTGRERAGEKPATPRPCAALAQLTHVDASHQLVIVVLQARSLRGHPGRPGLSHSCPHAVRAEGRTRARAQEEGLGRRAERG